MYNIYICPLFISIYLGGVLFSQKRWLDGPKREHGSWPILACRYSIHPLHQLRWQVGGKFHIANICQSCRDLFVDCPGFSQRKAEFWTHIDSSLIGCIYLLHVSFLQLGPAGFGVWRDDYHPTIPSEYSIESTYMIFTLHGCCEKLCNLHRYMIQTISSLMFMVIENYWNNGIYIYIHTHLSANKHNYCRKETSSHA